MYCVAIWHSILNKINLASKVLQKVTLDISGAENILFETINFLIKKFEAMRVLMHF